MIIATKPLFDPESGRPARFSNKYTVEEAMKLSADYSGKVDLIEDYMNSWFISRVEQIGKIQANTLVVLPTIFSVCEVIGQFETGNSGSGNVASNIKHTLTKLYLPIEHRVGSTVSAEKVADYLYKNLRNGLVHDGSARNGIIISTGDMVEHMSQEDNNGSYSLIAVNTMQLFRKLRSYFDKYVASLRGDVDSMEASRFVEKFDEIFVHLKE